MRRGGAWLRLALLAAAVAAARAGGCSRARHALLPLADAQPAQVRARRLRARGSRTRGNAAPDGAGRQLYGPGELCAQRAQVCGRPGRSGGRKATVSEPRLIRHGLGRRRQPAAPGARPAARGGRAPGEPRPARRRRRRPRHPGARLPFHRKRRLPRHDRRAGRAADAAARPRADRLLAGLDHGRSVGCVPGGKRQTRPRRRATAWRCPGCRPRCGQPPRRGPTSACLRRCRPATTRRRSPRCMNATCCMITCNPRLGRPPGRARGRRQRQRVGRHLAPGVGQRRVQGGQPLGQRVQPPPKGLGAPRAHRGRLGRL